MISVLQQQMAASAPQEARTPAPPPSSPLAVSEPADFEIVLGRGQVASTMLLVLVVLVVFGGGGYVIGKSASPKVAVVQAAAPAAVVPAMTAPSPEIANAAALITKAPVVPSPAVSKPLSADLSAPLYAEQATGKVYLQVGAVDKGLATIWAEGLRTHALSAFVAPGPNDKVWRVVIGPLPTPESFTQAKTTLDQLGINTFGRKQQ